MDAGAAACPQLLLVREGVKPAVEAVMFSSPHETEQFFCVTEETEDAKLLTCWCS